MSDQIGACEPLLFVLGPNGRQPHESRQRYGLRNANQALFYYDLVIGALATLLFIPVAVINRSYMRRSLMLNVGLNNQLEHEVQVIEAAQDAAWDALEDMMATRH